MTRPPHPFRILLPGDAAGPSGPMDLVLERAAFGGGTHPTTASCLAVLARLAPLAGARLLDLGAGTGILAIAALRLGAARAVCVDVNPDAVESARRNGDRNGVGDRLEHRRGSVDEAALAAPFDVVVANVGGDFLLDHAGRIAALARPGGTLLLSGVLREFEADLAAAYARAGARVVERRRAEAFCTLVLERV